MPVLVYDIYTRYCVLYMEVRGFWPEMLGQTSLSPELQVLLGVGGARLPLVDVVEAPLRHQLHHQQHQRDQLTGKDPAIRLG